MKMELFMQDFSKLIDNKKINKTMRTLNKLTSLQLIRNMKHIEYRNGLTTLGEVDESETKLSQYLNK